MTTVLNEFLSNLKCPTISRSRHLIIFSKIKHLTPCIINYRFKVKLDIKMFLDMLFAIRVNISNPIFISASTSFSKLRINNLNFFTSTYLMFYL